MSEEKQFTLEEVAQSGSTSYLVVIHKKVYDVTSFISEVTIELQDWCCTYVTCMHDVLAFGYILHFDILPTQHPGGAEILLDVIGNLNYC